MSTTAPSGAGPVRGLGGRLARAAASRARRRLRDVQRWLFPTRTTGLAALRGGSELAGAWPAAAAARLACRHAGASPEQVELEYPEKRALLLRNVHVWPQAGIAADGAGRVIRETCSSLYRLGRLVEWDGLRCSRIIAEARRCTAIECGTGYNNHYHWLVDVLPRVWTLSRPELEGLRPRVVFVRSLWGTEMAALLSALLPAGVSVEEAPAGSGIRAAEYLHLPCLAEDYCGWLPPGCLEWLRAAAWRLFDCAPRTGRGERIYVSRRRAMRRRITNERALESALGEQGFRSCVLEELPLAEQVRLFRSAEIVVGAHGAGLTNVLFSENVRLLELFPSPAYGHYRWLCHAAGHDYGNMCGPAASRHEDFTVDVRGVLERIELWLRAQDLPE